MLQKLGMHSVTVQYNTWPRAHRLEGPLLRDVLKAVGATGKTATVYALDGYGAKIPTTDLAAYPVVLALKSDGPLLGIGGRGPACVVSPPRDKYTRRRDATDREDKGS